MVGRPLNGTAFPLFRMGPRLDASNWEDRVLDRFRQPAQRFGLALSNSQARKVFCSRQKELSPMDRGLR